MAIEYRQWCFPAYIRVFRQIRSNDIHWCVFFPAVFVPYDSFRQYLFEKDGVISDNRKRGKSKYFLSDKHEFDNFSRFQRIPKTIFYILYEIAGVFRHFSTFSCVFRSFGVFRSF